MVMLIKEGEKVLRKDKPQAYFSRFYPNITSSFNNLQDKERLAKPISLEETIPLGNLRKGCLKVPIMTRWLCLDHSKVNGKASCILEKTSENQGKQGTEWIKPMWTL